jgi:adenylosuccinate lyase
LGRDVAHKLLDQAARQSVSQGRHLYEVLQEMPEIAQQIDPKTLQQIEVPEQYLGGAEQFRKRLLASREEKE